MKTIYLALGLIISLAASAQSTYSGICFTQAPGSPFASGTTPGNIVSADFNNDTRADLAVCNYGGNSVMIYSNNSSNNGTFTLANTIVVTNPTYVVTADFNNDGKKDLVIGTAGSSYSLRVYFGNGNGTFGTPTVYSPINYGVIYIGTADFNNDGAMDMACTTIGGSHYFHVLMNNGSGSFTVTKLYAPLFDDVCSFGVADVNVDGNKDAVFATTSTSTGRIAETMLGNGAGGFSTLPMTVNTTYYNLSGGGTQHLTLGDFNEDGRPDVASIMLLGPGNTSASSITVSLNSNSSFTTWSSYAVGTDPNYIGTADLNLDNHLDLIIANQGTNNISILAGNGQGSFAPAVNYSTGTNATNGTQPTSIAVNDFNADGFPDLAITNNSANTITILLNQLPKVVTNPVTMCSNINPANLSAVVTGVDTYTYLWSNGATTLNTTFTQSGTGIYNNTFIATNSTAQCSTTNIVPLTVNPSPNPFTVAPAVVCAGSSATLVVTPLSSHTTYNWSPSSTLNQATGSSVIATPPATTSYNIVATNVFGCTTSAATSVTVRTKPEVRYSPSSYVPGEVTGFYSSVNGSLYNWNVSTFAAGSVSFSGQGTNAISNVAWPKYCTQPATLHMISVKVDGCTSSEFIAPMCANGAIYNFPITGASTAAPASIQNYGIQNGTIPLILPVTWFVDGGTILSGQGTANVSVKWDKGYYGKIAFASTNGTMGQNGALNVAICNATAPVNPFSANTIYMCQSAGSTQLNAGNTGSAYAWSTGANQQTIAVTPPSLALTNYYYVTVTNTNGCKSSFSQGVFFNPGCREAGIASVEEKTFSLYPNPANSSFTLESNDGSVLGSVIIYNLFGQQVYSTDIPFNEATLDIRELPAGMYSVFAKGVKTKLVKE